MDINVDLLEEELNDKKKSNLKYNYVNNKNDKKNIQLLDFFSTNNIQIYEKIKQEASYQLRFDLFYEYNFINICELQDKLLENHKIVNEKNKYICFTYRTRNYTDFDTFMLHLPTPKLFIYHIIDSFQYLLKSLQILNKHNICFFNLNTSTIKFDNSFKPILNNFSESIQINNIEYDNLSKIIGKAEDYMLKPLEVHVLYFLFNSDETTLTYSSIESICDYFVKTNCILELYSKEYRENYHKTCINILKKYINQPKKVIIDEILKTTSATWDVYSLSMLYLYFVGNIIRVFSLKEDFLVKFSILLNKNISMKPYRRMKIEEMSNEFNKLYSDQVNWNFVNSLSLEKYQFFIKKMYTF